MDTIHVWLFKMVSIVQSNDWTLTSFLAYAIPFHNSIRKCLCVESVCASSRRKVIQAMSARACVCRMYDMCGVMLLYWYWKCVVTVWKFQSGAVNSMGKAQNLCAANARDTFWARLKLSVTVRFFSINAIELQNRFRNQFPLNIQIKWTICIPLEQDLNRWWIFRRMNFIYKKWARTSVTKSNGSWCTTNNNTQKNLFRITFLFFFFFFVQNHKFTPGFIQYTKKNLAQFTIYVVSVKGFFSRCCFVSCHYRIFIPLFCSPTRTHTEMWRLKRRMRMDNAQTEGKRMYYVQRS